MDKKQKNKSSIAVIPKTYKTNPLILLLFPAILIALILLLSFRVQPSLAFDSPNTFIAQIEKAINKTVDEVIASFSTLSFEEAEEETRNLPKPSLPSVVITPTPTPMATPTPTPTTKTTVRTYQRVIINDSEPLIIEDNKTSTNNSFDSDTWWQQVQEENRKKAEESRRQYEEFKQQSEAHFEATKQQNQADFEAFKRQSELEMEQWKKDHGFSQ